MIVAYIKPTNSCNVGCSHCYLPESVRADKYRMSEDTLHSVAEMLRDMSEASEEAISIIWHGGEPLMLPPAWFDFAGGIIDDIIGMHDESIQTSLIPWKDDYARIAHKRWKGHIGSSVDFSSRKIKGSVDAYHDLWMSKVVAARKQGVSVVPGCVPSIHDIGKASYILNWMSERGFDKFNIDRYNSFGQTLTERPSNGQHSKFLMDLFDGIMEKESREEPPPKVRTIIAGINGVLKSCPGDRWGGACQSKYVVVEPDGSTNNCPDKSSFEESFSNTRDGFSSFLESPQRKKWIRVQEVSHRKNHCLSCKFNVWCRSGCPITPNEKCNSDDECSGYSIFLNHVEKITASKERRIVAERYSMR